MTEWSDIMEPEKRLERGTFARTLLQAIEPDCLTRKPRDPVKRDLMRQLGLLERYPEVQYPSPGNTPEDLDENDLQVELPT